MKETRQSKWGQTLAIWSVKRPWWMLLAILVLTVVALMSAATLQMRLNFVDMLPSGHEEVLRYKEVVNNYGEALVVIAVEGSRDKTVAFADQLEPRLQMLEDVYLVQGRLPHEYILEHGFVLQDPDDFDRSLTMFADPTLLGTLSGFNSNLEDEYTEDESNIRDDEVQVVRGLLGTTRTLELLDGMLAGEADTSVTQEAVNALLAGDPYLLSLDREMLLVLVIPTEAMWEHAEAILETTERVMIEVEALVADHPDIQVHMTGMGPIGIDEMASVGTYTQVLMLVAWLLVYVLLARSFRSWGLPLLTMLPLVVGIIWTMGLIGVIFGSLNMMTVMLGLILIGLGIDFTLHLISRYSEERGAHIPVEEALSRMIGGTGTGVITGSLTTSAAFFALMIGDTKGVFEFGAAAGVGVLLTMLAVFGTLPPLLVIRERRYARKGRVAPQPPRANEGWPAIGQLAAFSWKRPAIVLPLFFLIAAGSLWAAIQIEFEYNFLELEPAGLKSVELQREIPERFGLSDQSGWVIAESVEEARALKDEFEELSSVGEVGSVSDFVTVPSRMDAYVPRLHDFRDHIESIPHDPATSSAALADEIVRLWDNLDAMSNLAYMGGIDRVWPVIDRLTGYDNATNRTDSTAVLPRLLRRLENNPEDVRIAAIGEAWLNQMRPAVYAMANPYPLTVADIPESAAKSYLPKDGTDRSLVNISPRKALWEREDLDRFNTQTATVSDAVVSTSELFIVMTEETLRDGRNGSLLALLVIAVLLFVHFRGAFGLMATVPLIGSAVLMLGTMYLICMNYNYINLIALPVILGIGIDDGVHALHRYREMTGERVDRVRDSFSRVGRAILLTSLTTMIGFGSIAFYTMRGMASFGMVLFLGVGFCFVATVLVLPAVMRVLTRNSTKLQGE